MLSPLILELLNMRYVLLQRCFHRHCQPQEPRAEAPAVLLTSQGAALQLPCMRSDFRNGRKSSSALK